MQKQQWRKNGKNRENVGMVLCHLKNLELEPQFQKYKGRVVFRGDIVKDDSGSNEVFTEQGSSASQMTAAKVMECHLKNAELEAMHQKYKGRVVLRGDIVKDDSGSYAVFTEQGSSDSQMTAAKVMDIISRLPGCDGQAADAVSTFPK